jgi:3-oxoacyl-(acyl-carrier-protein) synthase
MPANLRRRASLTTKMAITVATEACKQANVNPADLPSVFASVGGEIQVTDALCLALSDHQAAISPTQFHNSVHNTTAGYWGILHQCYQATTAIAAVDDTFAMGLLEAWSQLQQQPGDMLLVCYDELWPDYLAPPMGSYALASALVLSNTATNKDLYTVTQPAIATKPLSITSALIDFTGRSPAASVIPLLQAINNLDADTFIPLNMNQPQWSTQFGTTD